MAGYVGKRRKNDDVTPRDHKPKAQVLRFLVAAGIGLIPITTALIYELGLESVPFFATALTIGGAVVRVMSMEITEQWLSRFLPSLSGDTEEENKG